MAPQALTNNQLLEEVIRLRQLLAQSTPWQGNHWYQSLTATGNSQIIAGNVYYSHYYHHQNEPKPMRSDDPGKNPASKTYRMSLTRSDHEVQDNDSQIRACLRRLSNLCSNENHYVSIETTKAAIKDLATILQKITWSNSIVADDRRALKEDDLDRVMSLVVLTERLQTGLPDPENRFQHNPQPQRQLLTGKSAHGFFNHISHRRRNVGEHAAKESPCFEIHSSNLIRSSTSHGSRQVVREPTTSQESSTTRKIRNRKAHRSQIISVHKLSEPASKTLSHG